MRHLQYAVIVVVLLAGWLTSGQPAEAQMESGAIDVIVRVYLCEADPGSIGVAMGSDPDGCVRVDGVTANVATIDGVQIGACTTEGGFCLVPAPIGADVVVTEDLTTVPEGYRPRENPLETPAYTEFAGVIFVNLPLDQGTAEVPRTASSGLTTLPNTGTGSDASAFGSLLLSGAALFALVRAACALHRGSRSTGPQLPR